VVSALTTCEAIGKPAALLVTYCETQHVDSISTKPFFDALEKGNAGVINIQQDFSKMPFNLSRSSKLNLTQVADSNLYT
jgi:hypothetical protein